MKINKTNIRKFSYAILTFSFLFFLINSANAQSDIETTTLSKRKGKITPLPAISFSPETGLTYGIIGDYDFDLANGNKNVSMSKLRGSLVGTTKKQIISEWTYRLFFPNDDFRIFGRLSYKKFPDRDYRYANFGILPINDLFGNRAILGYATDDEGVLEIDSARFVKFSVQRLLFESSFLWKVKDNFYVGPTIDAEYLFNNKFVSDSVGFPSVAVDDGPAYAFSDSLEVSNNGRMGLGFHALYDTRDDKRNSYSGAFVQLMGLTYTNLFGADDIFSRLFFDARYFKPLSTATSNRTILGLQFIQDFRFSDDPINKMNYFSYSRLGGRDMLRGYFQGTYLDQHATSLQVELRQSLFDNYTGFFHKILSRGGFAAFASVGQAYGINKFDFASFNAAVGGGIRFSINKEQRTNIRIDYAFGLNKDSKFGEGGQSGLYFFLGESF